MFGTAFIFTFVFLLANFGHRGQNRQTSLPWVSLSHLRKTEVTSKF